MDEKTQKRLESLSNIIQFYGFIIALLLGFIIAINSNPNTLLFGVGQSLIASGLFALIMLLHQRSSLKGEEDSQNKLITEVRLLKESCEKDRGFSSKGLTHIYVGSEKKGIRKIYFDHMNSTVERIDILARKADGFVYDFFPVKDDILKKGTNVKILLVHPEEENFLRSIIINKKWDIDEAKRRIISNTIKILELKDSHVEVKWCKDFPPSVTISIFDNVLFITPYLVGKSHEDAATLAVTSEPLFREYYEHFDELWKTAFPPDIAYCKSLQKNLKLGK